MAISQQLITFAADTLGGTYGNPPPILVRNKGTFQGQCVSYVRQYCEAILGIKTDRWGDAKDWWINPKVLNYFDQIKDGSRQDGDILVWEDDRGNWTGYAGHIAIAYEDGILNQNWNGNLKVTTNRFFPNGYLGALRFKGDEKMYISEEEYKDLQNWKIIGIDAQPYKTGVVNSKSWTTDMQTDTNNITPVINDLQQYKRDNPQQTRFVPVIEQLYKEA